MEAVIWVAAIIDGVIIELAIEESEIRLTAMKEGENETDHRSSLI